jgi:hypothetical protein
MITESIVGAVCLAAAAISSGMHAVNHTRIKKLEKDKKIKDIEIHGIEISVLCVLGTVFIDKYSMKKDLSMFADNTRQQLALFENDLARIENRVASTQIDAIKAQNEVINAKVDHVANAVDIAIMENNE